MPNFPRATGAKPRLATVPRFPSALSSWGESGKGQFRSVQNMGRTWDEIYPLLDASNANVRALLEAINRSMREGVLWDVQHPYWHARKGVGGGSPVVGSQPHQVWQFDSSATGYVDETADANSSGANDWALFPAGAGDADAALVGFPVKFGRLSVNVGTAGVGTYTVVWEYWNGSAWTALSGVTDGTGAFKTAGTNNVTFTIPSNWALSSVNGSAQLYYVRAKRDSGTVTTDPLGTQCWVRDKVFGSSLVIEGASVSTSSWLKQGDIIKVAGGAVVLDVTADVATDAAGRAVVPISPPIFTGQTPADGAVVTIDPSAIYFKAYLVGVSEFPQMDSTQFISPGLTLTFREQPTV